MGKYFELWTSKDDPRIVHGRLAKKRGQERRHWEKKEKNVTDMDRKRERTTYKKWEREKESIN